MQTQKVQLNQLFKSGKNFKFKKVDYNSTRISVEAKEIKIKQAEIRKSAEVDLNELKKLIFTI